jgi:hypothetical protein
MATVRTIAAPTAMEAGATTGIHDATIDEAMTGETIATNATDDPESCAQRRWHS